MVVSHKPRTGFRRRGMASRQTWARALLERGRARNPASGAREAFLERREGRARSVDFMFKGGLGRGNGFFGRCVQALEIFEVSPYLS